MHVCVCVYVYVCVLCVSVCLLVRVFVCEVSFCPTPPPIKHSDTKDVCLCVFVCARYGVATISWLLKILGLFFKRAL